LESILNKVFSAKSQLILWNPVLVHLIAGAGKLRKYLAKTEILFLNKDEALELVVSERKHKKDGEKFLRDSRALAEALKDFGPKKIVITDGGNGADYFNGEIFYHEKSLGVPVKKISDTTGIGDAFCSTFAAGLEIYKGDYKKSMKLAMRNSASVLKKFGAQNGLIKINKRGR
jgi:sugar/nucleoside kinase (ribokinase family)